MEICSYRRHLSGRSPCTPWLAAWLISGALAAQSMELGEPFKVKGSEGRSRPYVTAIGENDFIVAWPARLRGGTARRVSGEGVSSPEIRFRFSPRDLSGGDGTFWAIGYVRSAPGVIPLVVQHLGGDGAHLTQLHVVTDLEFAYGPGLARAEDGSVMVAWFSGYVGPSTQPDSEVPLPCAALGSFARGFEPGGQAASGPFSIPSSQGATRVISDASGEFIVSGYPYCEPLGEEATGERRALDGSTMGLAFPLDGAAELAALSGGGFASVWRTDVPQPDGIWFRRYGPDGTPTGPATEIRGCSGCEFSLPHVAAGHDNDFLVVWTEYGFGTSETSLQARWVGARGVMSETLAVSTLEPDHDQPKVASDRNGRFLVSWSLDSPYDHEIWARAVFSAAIFSDGFESGDTGAWSLAVP